MTDRSHDFFPVQGIDHVEFYVANAKQASVFYCTMFGFLNTAYMGFETGRRDRASYLVEQGEARLVLTAPTTSDHPIAEHVHRHGDGVAIIAMRVPDAEAAYEITTSRGARGAV